MVRGDRLCGPYLPVTAAWGQDCDGRGRAMVSKPRAFRSPWPVVWMAEGRVQSLGQWGRECRASLGTWHTMVMARPITAESPRNERNEPVGTRRRNHWLSTGVGSGMFMAPPSRGLLRSHLINPQQASSTPLHQQPRWAGLSQTGWGPPPSLH